jgi:hypothetical protein
VPKFCNEPKLLPPSTQALPVLFPGKLSEIAYQLEPLLMRVIVLLDCDNVHELRPSIVCDDVVAIVSADALELTFLTT